MSKPAQSIEKNGSSETPKLTFTTAFEPILKASLSAGSLFSPDEQARLILDEVIRIFGVERGFIFWNDETTGKLILRAGRTANGETLSEITSQSGSVVQRAALNRQIITENGASQEGEGAVVHLLRSTTASPLVLDNRLIGVIYLDNAMDKGSFDENEIYILRQISNLIATIIDASARSGAELERRMSAKDLELSWAVQTMLLPQESIYRSESVDYAVFYKTAARAGGDWWSADVKADGSLKFLMGDVTGQGIGSAMVTATVASAYRTFKSLQADGKVISLLDNLNKNLVNLCEGAYWMTFTGVRVDANSKMLTFWSASAPPIFIIKKDGNVVSIASGGSPLGCQPELDVAEKSVKLEIGDRIFIFTDGCYEFSAGDGSHYGLRRLFRLAEGMPFMSAEESKDYFAKKLITERGSELDDDVTFAVLMVGK